MKDKIYSGKKSSLTLGFFLIVITFCAFLLTTYRVDAATYKDLWDEDKNAYIIQSEEDFVAFRDGMVSEQYEGKNILLEKDITLTKPLVKGKLTTSARLKGYFDGQGHTIEGIAANDGYIFGRVEGVVTNTKFTNIALEAKARFAFSIKGEISYCTFQGTVQTSGTNMSLFGASTGAIKNCIFDIEHSSSSANVNYCAGVASGGTYENCISVGKIHIGDDQKETLRENAGITYKGDVKNCYYLEDPQYTEASLGTSCTEEELKNRSTYEGFDFDNVWDIDETGVINKGYPYLRSDISEEFLPTRMDVTDIPITYSVSLQDVLYDSETKTYDRYFPIILSEPEYTGTDENIKSNLKQIMQDCSFAAEVIDPSTSSESIRNMLEAIPSNGYTKDLSDVNIGNYFVKVSSKPSSETKYKFNVTFVWEKPVAYFKADVEQTVLTEEEKAEYLKKARETMKVILDTYVDKYPGDFPNGWQGDPWFALTCARCEYYPDGITEDQLYQYIVEQRWEQYKGMTQEELPVDFDMNTVSKDILAITAIGYDATNVEGIDLVDILKKKSVTNGNYFAAHYQLYALYSGNYSDNCAEMAKQMVNINYEDLISRKTADDMYVMAVQPVFLFATDEEKAKIVDWLSQCQTIRGTFPGYNGYMNYWTNAQVHMLMGLLNIDCLSPEFVKDGATCLDMLIAGPEGSLNYLADKAQCARGLAALIRSAEGKTNLFDCSDVQGARYVNQLIAVFADKEEITLEDEQDIVNAREAYDKLSDGKKAAVKNYQKLENAEAVLNQEKELQAKAQAFCDKVDALPALGELTLDSKADVAALQEELSVMSEEVKAYVSEEYQNKVAAYTERILNLEEAGKVIDKINAIGEVTLESETDILAARQAYESLVVEAQKDIVSSTGALDILERAEEALKNLQNAAVRNVIQNIEQFRDTDSIVLADKDVLKDVRDLYEQLPDSLKDQVTNLDVLETAERIMKSLETDQVLQMINALKNPEELRIPNEDGSVTDNITKEDITAIAETKAAFEALTDSYQGIEDEIKAMEGGQALLDKFDADVEIASEYEGYVEVYLKGMIEEILNFPQVDASNVTRAEELLGKYDEKYETDGAYLESVEGLTEKAASLRTEAQTIRNALNEAAAVDQLIENLVKEPITSDEMLEAAEAALAAVENAYGQLSELAQGYVKNVDAWNTAVGNVIVYKNNKAEAEVIEKLIQDALLSSEENLTDDSTVIAVKLAEEAYKAATADVQALVVNADKIRTLKEEIVQAKNQVLAENEWITIKETIPYDVVVKITEADSKITGDMESLLKTEKKAELEKAFTLEKYRILSDGSTESWSQDLTAVLHCADSLSGRNIYVLQSADVNSYLKTITSGKTVTFTMDEDGVYALGLSEAASDPEDPKEPTGGNPSGGNPSGGNPSGGNPSGSNPNSGTTGKTANTGNTSSGASGKTASGSSGTSVPKTGDTIPQETAATALVILVAAALLVQLNRKRKTL